jgi:hypothetical protein
LASITVPNTPEGRIYHHLLITVLRSGGQQKNQTGEGASIEVEERPHEKRRGRFKNGYPPGDFFLSASMRRQDKGQNSLSKSKSLLLIEIRRYRENRCARQR